MKKLFLFTLMLSSVTFWAQTAESIIQDYISSIGGKQLEKVHSIKQTGLMGMNGMDIPMETYQDTDGKMYTKMNLMGQEIVAVAFDGQKGYMFDNMSFGYKDLPDSLANGFKQKAKNLFGYFYRYKQNGAKVKYLGKQNLDNKSYDVVMLSFDQPVEGGLKDFTAFFDPQTHLIAAVKVVKDGHIIMTKPQDYKAIDGVKMPMKIITEYDGNPATTIKLDIVEINPPAPDPAVFTKPKQ